MGSDRPARRRLAWLVAALGLLLFSPEGLRAQDYITPDCRALVPPKITFDDSTHQAWYRRFWNGQCEGLPLFTCFGGDPNWNKVVRKLLAQTPPSEQARALPSLCMLGHTIAFEWARDNAIRRISTQDLRDLTAVLTGPGDLASRLQRTDARVSALLARPR